MARKYGPTDGLHVCLLTTRQAEAHRRRAYNVPDHVGLGWRPYTILVTSYGGVAHTAFHRMEDFRRWLGPNYRVRLNGQIGGGIRSGRIIART